MKKTNLFALAAVLIFTVAQLSAGEPAETSSSAAGQSLYDVFQVGVFPGIPPNQNRLPVHGMRFGLPFCGGDATVNGFDFGLLATASNHVNGFSLAPLLTFSDGVCNGFRLALVNKGDTLNGLEIGVANFTERANGVQVGVVNYASDRSFQIGLVNMIPNGWLPFMILINFNF